MPQNICHSSNVCAWGGGCCEGGFRFAVILTMGGEKKAFILTKVIGDGGGYFDHFEWKKHNYFIESKLRFY